MKHIYTAIITVCRAVDFTLGKLIVGTMYVHHWAHNKRRGFLLKEPQEGK